MTSNTLRKLRQLFDEANDVWFDVYDAPGVEGRPITVEVPREDRQPETLRRFLRRKGVEESAVADLGTLAGVIANDAPVVHRAARAGWRDGAHCYVSHRHAAGEESGYTVVPPDCPIVGVGGQNQVRGSLDSWRARVEVARHSTAMTVALCAVFAAPLLAVVQRPSFALVFHGPSRIGKSFAQLVAASALGYGREEDLPSFNATDAGLLATAVAFNDHMLPINEIGTAKGPKDEIYVVMRDATYRLMNGQDTLRHPSWTGAGGNASGSFKVICLMSSELSPDAWAARNGETRDAGEMARLIGVPVLFEDLKTIFDRPPLNLSDAELTAWEAEQFRRLRQELPEHRGVAFREYLDALLDNFEHYSDRARDLLADFEELTIKPGMSSIARDIVAKFGVLYAGGMIAVETDVLPLGARTVRDAIYDACLDALAELPDPEAELRADIGLLRTRLMDGGILDLDACTRRELRMMREADGYQQLRNAGREFVVRSQVFAGWFGSRLRIRRLLEWLDEEGFLDHDRARTQTRSNEWAQRQVKWPDQTRVRSISLYLPAGLADLVHNG